MKRLIGAIFLADALACVPHAANAKGCMKGDLVGGVAGHCAHHHAIAGAMGACVGGHYLAKCHAQRKATPTTIQ